MLQTYRVRLNKIWPKWKKNHLQNIYCSFEKKLKLNTFYDFSRLSPFSRLFPGLENFWANFKTFSRIQDSVWTLVTLHWRYNHEELGKRQPSLWDNPDCRRCFSGQTEKGDLPDKVLKHHHQTILRTGLYGKVRVQEGAKHQQLTTNVYSQSCV